MKTRISRIVLSLAVLTAGAFGGAALLSPIVTAGDEPCDLVHGQIQACRDAHGRWSSVCCCCIFRN